MFKSHTRMFVNFDKLLECFNCFGSNNNVLFSLLKIFQLITIWLMKSLFELKKHIL